MAIVHYTPVLLALTTPSHSFGIPTVRSSPAATANTKLFTHSAHAIYTDAVIVLLNAHCYYIATHR
jgi:hypothetical protein